MDEERIDFSSIDPSQDAVRWEKRVQHILRAAGEAKKRPLTLWAELAASVKPALTAAAVAACICLAGSAAMIYCGTTTETTLQTEPASALAVWAAGDDLPSTDQILQILGGNYVEK